MDEKGNEERRVFRLIPSTGKAKHTEQLVVLQ